MSTVTIQEALEIGQGHLFGGRLGEAEAVCQQILAAFPEQPGALHLLAGVAVRAGRVDLAEGLLRRSIAADPAFPAAHAHLGLLLAAQGRAAEAAASYERAVALAPEAAELRLALGNLLLGLARPAEARLHLTRAVESQPGFAAAHHSLGEAACRVGRTAEATEHFRHAVRLAPDFAEAHKRLGAVLLLGRRSAEARPVLARALALNPDDAESHNNLGTIVASGGRLEEARSHFARATELAPGFVAALDNLGMALRKLGRTREARACWERVLAIAPGHAGAYNNLGSLFRTLGRHDEAIEFNRQAVATAPERTEFHHDLVLAHYYHPEAGGTQIGAELRRWHARHTAPLQRNWRSHGNDRDPERPLRVGYVSPDFCVHVMSNFTLPLLEAHDPARVEIHCYASVRVPDGVTARLRRAAHGWRDVLGLTDHELAEQVRADGMDVLVDLSSHTGHSRLRAFGYKPAPVQVTWLAFAGSTGVEAVDYRLTDRAMEPPGADMGWATEEPVFLPDAWCCYGPAPDPPPVAAPPAMKNGFVTFGSLNNLVKVNGPTLRRWARALRAVPRSRLLLHAPEDEARTWVAGVLAGEGVEAERLEFVGRQPYHDYLRTYDRIDVGLDPFPFNGMTTTCDALWMGVPVLSLPGEMPASRAGLSLLKTVGLEGWVARDEEEYARKAAELTGSLSKLWRLRTGLRRRMQASALLDAPRFARNVEAAYRGMWRRWVVGEGRRMKDEG